QLLWIVVEAIRHAPIGRQRRALASPGIGERLETLTLERRGIVRIGFQINDAIVHEGEHDAVGKDAGAAEHAAHPDRTVGGKQFADVVGSHRRGRRPYRCASAAGLSWTDSPQPQAEVWFGLLNTNCAESLSVL